MFTMLLLLLLCLCYFGNHTKDERNQHSFLIGSYIYQNTKLQVIREKNFTLTRFLPEEFGSSTISQLFQKRLMQLKNTFLLPLAMISSRNGNQFSVWNFPLLSEIQYTHTLIFLSCKRQLLNQLHVFYISKHISGPSRFLNLA